MKQLRSPQWKVISAVLAMVAGVSLVSALLAHFEIRQRERALADAHAEISSLREQIRPSRELPEPDSHPAASEPVEEVFPGPLLDDEDDLNHFMNEIEQLLTE